MTVTLESDAEGTVLVTENYSIDVNNSSYFYNPGVELSFYLQDLALKPKATERQFKKDSLSIKDGYGRTVQYTTKELTDGIQLNVILAKKVDSYNPYSLSIKYKTHELINQNGNITNIYVPGIAKDTKFEEKDPKYGIRMRYNYDASVIVPSTLPQPSYTQPREIKSKTDGKTTTYTIGQNDRLGTLAWLQLGNAQYYHFRIEQITPKTDNITPTQISKIASVASTNIYKLAIPRELDETNQQIFISSIEPKPKKIERDAEGNLVAIFEMPANTESGGR